MLRHMNGGEMVGITGPWGDGRQTESCIPVHPEIGGLNSKIVDINAELLGAQRAAVAVSEVLETIIDAEAASAMIAHP